MMRQRCMHTTICRKYRPIWRTVLNASQISRRRAN
jgi:hypothetical protein